MNWLQNWTGLAVNSPKKRVSRESELLTLFNVLQEEILHSMVVHKLLPFSAILYLFQSSKGFRDCVLRAVADAPHDLIFDLDIYPSFCSPNRLSVRDLFRCTRQWASTVNQFTHFWIGVQPTRTMGLFHADPCPSLINLQKPNSDHPCHRYKVQFSNCKGLLLMEKAFSFHPCFFANMNVSVVHLESLTLFGLHQLTLSLSKWNFTEHLVQGREYRKALSKFLPQSVGQLSIRFWISPLECANLLELPGLTQLVVHVTSVKSLLNALNHDVGIVQRNVQRILEQIQDKGLLDSECRYHIKIPGNLKQLTLQLDRVDRNIMLPQINKLENLELTNFFIDEALMQQIVHSESLKHFSFIRCEFGKANMAVWLQFYQKRAHQLGVMRRSRRKVQSIC